MKMQMMVISKEEKQFIHNQSMQILEEVGIKFPSEYALDLLEKGGAKIDRDKKIAYISREMVKQALSSAPKKFTLAARNKEYDFRLPSDFTGYHLDGCGAVVVDLESGKRRTPVLADIADAARVFEEMDLGYICWPPLSPLDVPYKARSIAATAECFMNTSKHIQDEIKTIAEIPYVMELIKTVLGGRKEEIGRDIYSVVYCTVSPLCHDKEMLEANIELCKYKVPIVVLPMCATTTTGPASLYSNAALSNAEALSALVMFQLAAPGTPIIYASAIGVSNPQNGRFSFSSPEAVIQLAAMIEMGKYYSLPVTIAGCATDAKAAGSQSAMEKIATNLPLVLAQPDSITGFGMFECSTAVSLSQIVIDNEIAGYCDRIRQGMNISEETDFYQDIKQVGHGGHFLKQRNTRVAVRSKEFYRSNLFDRGSYDEWMAAGCMDMDDFAREKVRLILAGEQKNPLPEHVEKVLNEIVKEAMAKLAE